MLYLFRLFFVCSFILGTVAHAQKTTQVAPSSVAIFAGGCFWCLQPPYDKLKDAGVLDTKVGYSGGSVKNPTYAQVSGGESGHREVLQVIYDPAKISFEKLLEVFWNNIDPFDAAGQFCDKGFQYTSAIYFTTEDQKRVAEASKSALMKKFPALSVVTPVEKAAEFYSAEDYHQSYYLKNSLKYKYYRYSCGRDKRLQEIISLKSKL